MIKICKKCIYWDYLIPDTMIGVCAISDTLKNGESTCQYGLEDKEHCDEQV